MIGTTNAIEQRIKRAFISDGLRMHLDGIENTRSGHKTDITTWEDLSGYNIDWVRMGSGITFSNNCVVFPGSDTFQPASGSDPTLMDGTTYLNNYTFQYTFQKTNSGGDAMCWFYHHALGHWSTYILSGSTSYPTCYPSDYSSIALQFHQITVIYAPTGVQFYINNNLYPVNGGSNSYGNAWRIGNYGNYYFAGKIYAIRVWNRPLTEAERSAMLEYDKNRFNMPV